MYLEAGPPHYFVFSVFVYGQTVMCLVDEADPNAIGEVTEYHCFDWRTGRSLLVRFMVLLTRVEQFSPDFASIPGLTQAIIRGWTILPSCPNGSASLQYIKTTRASLLFWI